MVDVADQTKPHYHTFGPGKRKPKPKPKPKPKRTKGQKLYMGSRTAAGKKLYGKLPSVVQTKLKKATVGESAKILRAHREVQQMSYSGVKKPRKRIVTK